MMLISNGICQFVRIYAVLNKIICHFLGPLPSALSDKKFQSTGTYTNGATLRSGFFFRETRSVTVPRFGFFFQDSRIRVKAGQLGYAWAF